jgi:type I restriction enzyme, R subunit
LIRHINRHAVTEAFGEFLADSAATLQQIGMVDMVIEHTTEKDTIDPGRSTRAPSSTRPPEGAQQVFGFEKTKWLSESAVG